jgi:hypothetical protein
MAEILARKRLHDFSYAPPGSDPLYLQSFSIISQQTCFTILLKLVAL